jgi:hypothetical protein
MILVRMNICEAQRLPIQYRNLTSREILFIIASWIQNWKLPGKEYFLERDTEKHSEYRESKNFDD